MKMDYNSSDQSPPLSDNNGSSWGQCWDNEDSSLSGLNFENATHDLHHLVDDKEIAARAVALVVNSTRKGIVPLCADVASLLRAKRNLEARVHKLRSENDSLRSSASLRTSHSTSPAPQSITSYSTDHGGNQMQERPCSRCSSQCSSLVSNSPKMDKMTSHSRSPRLHRTSAFTSVPAASEHTTVAMVHAPPNGISTQTIPLRRENGEYCNHTNQRHQRKGSLPEIVSEPSAIVPKINPKARGVCKEVQCDMEVDTDTHLEEQFRESVETNSRLSEDLGAARKEIALLRGRLKELQMQQLAREYTDEFHVENECELSTCTDSAVEPAESRVLPIQPPLTQCCVATCHQGSNSSVERGSPRSPVTAPSPLEGCLCSACNVSFTSTENIKGNSPKLKNKSSVRNKNKIHVKLNDHVVIQGDKTGHVRYIGHLDDVMPANAVHVGLELDAPVGNHDGKHNSRQYFSCQANHGVFVPISDVICVITRKGSSKQSCSGGENPRKGSRKSVGSGIRSQFRYDRSTEKRHIIPDNTKQLTLPRNPAPSQEQTV